MVRVLFVNIHLTALSIGWNCIQSTDQRCQAPGDIQISFSTWSFLEINGHWNPSPTCRNKQEPISITESTQSGREKGQFKWEPLKLSTYKAMYEWLQLLSLPMQKLNTSLISLILASYPNATAEFPISVQSLRIIKVPLWLQCLW